MTSKETVLAFIDAINAHDVARLAGLMTDGHRFIDAHGNEISGREQMRTGWRGYFEWFPDYRIEVAELFERDDTIVLVGFAGGSLRGNKTKSWRLPAAWKAVVTGERLTLWQVFADTKIPFELINEV